MSQILRDPRRHFPAQHLVAALSTVRSQQNKLKERLTMPPLSQHFRPGNADKVRLREQSHSRPASLNEATVQVKQFTKWNEFDKGWAAYKAVEDPDAALHCAALNLCARALWWNEAWQIWESLPQKWRSVISYTTMIDVCARCKRPSEAECLFEEMRSSELEPNLITYTVLMKAFSMSEQPSKALEAFDAMRPLLTGSSVNGRQIAYQVVMAAFARAGDYAKKTRELFIEMTSKGVPADRGHFNSLMAACASAGDASTATAIFDHMVSSGLAPDVQSYTVLISCCRYDLNRCMEIRKSMQQAGIVPTGTTFQELLEAHILARDSSGARALLEE
eukprot:CAMPEP_0180518074 /NCGR_PEP_ID=MMETSP1036_2-20121128/54889_1 /TAXON_ID=632150 /ORGANISM="Azadinium spinosum, Strain 3D9" /LENGTH=332 /DNA_ID=CAMNT_0022530179 /DNA_START=42 /DNA_END=1037 /DNA_ORIENTATION=+